MSQLLKDNENNQQQTSNNALKNAKQQLRQGLRQQREYAKQRQSAMKSQFSGFTQPRTSRQRLLAQVETGDKWYSGDKPTRSEAAARIYTISQTDPERGKQLYHTFSQLQRDPSSQFYNPYGAATNKAIQELANLGVDVSGGITEDWLAKNSWLKAYYRTSGNSGTPLAPTKSSTAEQNAAYYYYQILKAQDTTNQAEAEWKALQEEIGYWANRKDRNYSDDQIISKIDWSNYKTLARMDDGAASGVPLTLNSAIGYSQDALKGVIWAARNGSTGNPLADSAKAVLGAGKTWQEDKKISAKLDPSSKAYSPYSVGSTLDDAALYFGVDSFSKDWLENNRGILAGNDATAKKMYQTVYNAEQTTLKAEQELDDLHADIDRYLESTTDPDQILRMIDGEYKTLDSLDESMREGKLIGTTRAINYRKQDIEFDVRRRCLVKNTQINGSDYVGAVRKLLGLPEVKAEAGSAVGASRDNAINAGGATIADAGTDEEKTVFKTAYSSDFDTYLTQIKGAMDSGVSDPQGGYDYTLKRADQYAAENYMDAMDTVLTYEEAQQAKDEAIKKLNDLGVVYDEDGNIDMTNRKGSLIVPGADTAMAAAGMSDAPRKLRHESTSIDDEIFMLREEIETGYGEDEDGERVRLTDEEIKIKKARLSELQNPSASQKEINQLLAVVDESTETMERTQKSYDKANITLKNITEGYAVADRMQALTGVKAGDSDSTLAQMTYLFSIARNYEPTEYRSANLYALAMDGQRATYEETAAAAKKGMAQNKQMIKQINFALGELESKGAHLPDDKMENVKRYVAALERDVQDAEYFLLRENDDYYQESQDVSNEIFAAWQDYNELNPLGMLNPFADRKGYTALDNVVAIRLEQLQMEEASKTVGRNLKSDKVIMSTGNPAKDGYYTEDINQLSKNECMTYLYIRGKEGVDAAQEYYDHLTNAEYGVINMRRNLDWTAKAKEFADQNAVTGALASALTVIASPLNVGGMVESIKADVLGQDLNPYARGFVYGNMSSTARATVEENISESVGGGAGGWLLGKLYETLMSYGDAKVGSYFMGGLGYAAGSGAGKLLAKIGLTENYAKLASKVVSSYVTASGQGMQAVGNAMMDAKLRGATPAEARVLGLVTFLAETATEAIEVETIDSAIHGGAERKFKNTFKKLLFNMFNEGAGEGVSELVEGMADKVVMDYKSNWAESVQRYIDEGMTKKQAEDAAWKEIMWNAVEAAAVGGISGGLGTGLGYVQGRIFGDGSQTKDAVQPTAETVQQTQQTAQEAVQDVQQEQTAQDAQEAPTIAQETQNADVENVVPETAEAAQTPNTKEETQPFDTGERLTQYEVNEKTVRQVTALTASLDADEASQTATIGAALLGENATPQETAFASAAAQHLTDTLGSDAAVRFTRDVLLLDSDSNGVRAALLVAALNKGGNASQVAQRMAQEGVTADGIQELKAAADLDVQDANVTAQMQQTVQENQVALRTAQLIGDGALKAVQPYETAVAQAKSALRQAQGELRRQVKRLEGLGQNLLSLQEQINSGTATPQLLDTFRSTVKDIEGQMKVVNEYNQRVANAEQSLHDAQNQLDTVRDDTLRQVRQQAQQDVMSTWEAQTRVDSNAAKAYNDTSEVSDNAVQHRSVDQSQAADAGQLAESSGRDDGRRDYLYAGQGAGRGADSGGAEGATRDIGQDNSGVYARLRVLSPNARNNLTQRGVTDLHLQEGQDQQRFSDALNAAKASNDHGAYVDAQSVEQLTEKGAKLIVSEDGLAGAAVATTGKEKGNIFAVFKDAKSTARGASAELLIQAIAEGGNKLDCYAGKLAAMYAKIGMEPVARVAFNEEFMPDGWNTARDDHPDIIFWKHNGDSADTVAQKYGLGESEGGYHVYTTEELNSLPLFDDVTDANGETQYGYDRAWDYRDSLIDAEVMQNETAGQGNDQSVQASYGVPGVTSTGKSGTAGAVVSPIVTAQQLAEQEATDMQAQQAEAQEKTGYQKKSLNDANVPPATPTQDNADTQNDSGEKYRQFGTQTAQSTDALFQETRDYLLHNSVYEADSNTEQIDRAIDWVRGQATSNDPTGYFAAKSAVLDPSFDYASADGQARMLTVMQMSILMGDAQGQVQIADIFNRQGTSLAQALQARKIFYMMSPAAQAASIQKIANNLSQENGVTVTVPQDALDRLSQAKTMDEAQKIKNQIVRELYQQLPANWKSRLNGLRYLAMLANPRTHIRNILGNTIMQGMAYVRDKINAALERFFLPQEERTKSFKTKKEYRDAAKALYAEFSSLFDGNAGKYNPEMNRRSFNTQWLQKLADLNTNLLDKEDIIAMSRNFIHYLAGFMQARGWDVNNLTDAQKQEAVQYAFTNAEKNVYHQASKLAEWLNKLGRDKDSSVFDKLGHMVIEGVLPFKKTPINILKTGIEYSPIGLINSMTRGLYQMNQYRQTNGKKGISTAQFLQNLSSGLTGSGLMGVGALMMANGLLRVGFKDKDPEDEYARLTGSQEFSIELFGHSYTIDWTAPSSIPLFMGAAMYKEIENRDEGLTWGNAFDVFMSTISATAEPMLNMTMLDGVNSTIQSVAYANATGSSVGDIIMQSLLNLSTQLVPTSLGAVARTIDPVRRKTYADKNLNIPTWLQYPWERVQNKLPGLSQLNMPYLNAWGEEDREDNLLMRIFENFLSPGYVSKTEADSVETELRDISVRTGTNLISDLPNQSFSFNNEKINLTAEQYEQYVKTRGRLMHTELERLFATDEYKAMSLGAQASCIKNIQTWADEQGKVSVYPEKTIAPKWMDTKDIVPAVIERRASEDRQAYQNEAYSNIQNAIDNDDAATARDWVYALNQAGVENSDIKEKMTTLYKSEYQYAIRSGDRETARKIEGMLLAMDIGYKAKNFISWEKDAYKEE